MTPPTREVRPGLLAAVALVVAAALAPAHPAARPGVDVLPPRADDSVRFAVIGDAGTGGPAQYEVGRRLAEAREVFPFTFALMLGDNLYGSERPQDFQKKFELPYKPLLDAGVKFHASLGNHDDPNQRYYKPFNMDGQRYYTFTKGPVRFFALDSNYLDRKQLDWLQGELARANEAWKVAFFHHPPYSSGATHGSEVDLRELLEPLFQKHGVSVVFSGHDHFYERLKPQHGIQYFISGAAGKLRKGNIRQIGLTASGFDRDNSFMLVEIAGDTCAFQAITRTGQRIDEGSFARPAPVAPVNSGSP